MTNNLSPLKGTLWKPGAQAPSAVGGRTFTPAASYPSSSSEKKRYTVCEVSDGTTSCDCMGWTRRNPPGGRNCKHTRDYEIYLRATWQTAGGSLANRFTGNPAAAPDIPNEMPVVKATNKEKGGSLADLFSKLGKG